MTVEFPHGRFPERTYRAQGDFRCALRRYFRVAEENARRQGIMPQQYLALLAIRGHDAYPQVSVGALADVLQIRQSSVSLLVERLVRAELVHRVENSRDRRRVAISLSDRGQQVLDTVMTENLAILGDLEDRLLNLSLGS